MSDDARHSVSVAAAIFNDDETQVLLIKRRDNGRWEPPGGVLELGEAITSGLIREVREETGAEVEVGQLTGVYKNMAHGIVALVFRCTLTSPPSDATEEAVDVSWRPIEELRSLMREAFAVRVTDALSGDAPVIRHHDGQDLL